MTSCRIFHSSSVTPLPQKLGRFHTMASVSLLTWATLLSSQAETTQMVPLCSGLFSFLFQTSVNNERPPGRLLIASRHVTHRCRKDTVHHSDRGVQYVSTRYTERLAEAGIEPSVGSRGDSYDNALAESIIGLYKTEVIRRRGPWRGPEDVEFATLEWVHWYNTQRLLEPIGNVAPVEYEMNYYRSQEGSLEMRGGTVIADSTSVRTRPVVVHLHY